MWLLLMFVGAVLGGAIDEGEGALFGAALGVTLGVLLGQRTRVAELERKAGLLQQDLEQAHMAIGQAREQQRRITERVTALEQRMPQASPPVVQVPPSTKPSAEPATPSAGPPIEPPAAVQTPAPTPAPASAALNAPEPAIVFTNPRPTPAPALAKGSDPIGNALGVLRELVFGGNTVVRVGILVLLVGVTLLLKYAADHALFPIELRMASAGMLGMALVGTGLKLRERQPGFARTLQGGGIAALYLVVFFSYRTYGLVPSGLTFALLTVIAAASAALAVAQSSMALVVIGQAGGFLSPILASSGGGDHVALFSYYLILNLGIFAVALFRAFRPLNLLGFVFTFGIGTTWGVLSYRPEHFATTEPFLIAFYLLYVAIPVLYALRHGTRGMLDGTLLFGAPLSFLVLQRLLVGERPFAMAWTTLGMGALYLGLVRLLRARAPAELRAMLEVFLALGVGFATLAVPYGLDNAGLSGATWAIEGAGLYWVGVRQQRRLPRVAGVVLQAIAGCALIWHLQGSYAVDRLPFVNVRMLAAALLALSSLFIARHAHAHRDALPALEWRSLQALIAWALSFVLPALVEQIEDHTPASLAPGLSIGATAALAIALELAGRRLAWPPARYPAAVLLVLLYPVASVWDADLATHLLARGGFIGWPLFMLSIVLTLRGFAPAQTTGAGDGAPSRLRWLHPLALWGVLLTLGLELERVARMVGMAEGWQMAGYALPAVAMLPLLWRPRALSVWPLSAQPDLYRGAGALGVALGLLLWTLSASLAAPGDSAPLPYLPLINPLDLVQLLALGAVLAFHRVDGRREPPLVDPELRAAMPFVLAAAAFLAWNALLARAVHQLADVPFAARSLWRAMPLQVAMSISWSVIGLGVTTLASRRGSRAPWMAGATLLGVVVLKLFVVDLERLGTVPKIATFLIVGLLLLGVGYFAPVPPSHEAKPEPEAP